MTIKTKEQLRALYQAPNAVAIEKERAKLDQAAINFIKQSPFVVISTVDKNGRLDTSPRGGAAGFVKAINEKLMILPDAQGNNRLDCLMNIIETGEFSCLFMVPGLNETLRVVGKAKVTTEPHYLSLDFGLFKPPKSCIAISIVEVFLHCTKSIQKAELWSYDI